jgi:predicted nuclease with RNAse H fold
MRFIGVHLGYPRPTRARPPAAVVAVVDENACVEAVTELPGDALAAPAVPGAPGLVAIGAPVCVPNATGRRSAEEILAWCDVNVFPASRERLERLLGGIPGEAIAEDGRARGFAVVETLPSVAMRQLAWEAHTAGVAMDLVDYRERWLATRAPDYTPGGRSAPAPAALEEARRLLAGVLALPPTPDGPPLGAAQIGALACAYAALRSARPDLGQTLRLEVAPGEEIVLPADVNLLNRAALHQERMARERLAAEG